jgi:hypothetical protein
MIQTPTMQDWLKFLCHKEQFHNLCISFPQQITNKDQGTLTDQLIKTIIHNLQTVFHLDHKEFVHTDVLQLGQQAEALAVSHLQQLDEFLSYSSLYLPCKIVLLQGPVPLTQIVSNKILKILEDPPIPVSFLLVGFSYSHFLPTVKSRFLNWRLLPTDCSMPISSANESLDLPIIVDQWSKFSQSRELEQWAEQTGLDINSCISLLWQIALPTFKTAPEIDRLISFQRWHEQSELWSNPLPERWYFLFQMIKSRLQYKS